MIPASQSCPWGPCLRRSRASNATPRPEVPAPQTVRFPWCQPPDL
ncbi:hypothetical protein HMPREF9566_02304 [Cutibacterium acnes HL045PA1]|nr:hypothetical protein HMPREF9566_02304 [Cutibacterium acnes HL045PA1]